MASLETGETFTQEQYDLMTPKERSDKKLVQLTEQDRKAVAGMNREQRRAWLKANKKFKGAKSNG